MKKLFYLFTLSLLVGCASGSYEDVAQCIIPYPNDIELSAGEFNAYGAEVVCAPDLDPATVSIITAFAERLATVSGGKNPVVEGGDAESGFLFANDQSLPAEAYTLDIEPQRVKVCASSLRGFNYAIQTIKQLLPIEIFGSTRAKGVEWTMPCARIEDAPRFAYRGLHLDEARHFFGVETVKKYLDIMEIHKLNTFHWHLTDDQGWRIEIKQYPELTEIGSIRKGTCVKKDFTHHDGVPYGQGMWYTQEQIREVVAYAASKGIDVVPEIDLPGHMVAALAAYPELGCTGGPYEVWTRWGVSEDVLCAGNEKTYEFLENVLTEVCELFPYEYIHIGGDECPKVSWEKCPKCQAKIKALGLKDSRKHSAEHYLQSYVMSRIEKFLNDKGRKVIGWDEILEGEIAPTTTIMSWRGVEGGIAAATMGLDAIMTPNTYFYLDYYQSQDIANEPFGIGGYLPVEKCYSYEPCPEDMTDQEKTHILGVQANLWTEYIADEDHLFYMLLPRLAALSEVQWCSAERKSWDRFYDAIGRACTIYDIMGYEYADHILQVKGEVSALPESNSARVELSSQGNNQIYYTLDGKKPGKRSKKYTEPLTIDKTCELRAVVFRKGVEQREFVRKFDFHKAVGKKVTSSCETFKRYTPGKLETLVDGIRGPQIFKCHEWVAWSATPVDVTIDMAQTEPYGSVTVGVISDKPSYIFHPAHLAVAVSEDGEEFVEVASQEYEQEGEYTPDMLGEYTLSFPQTTARYLKVTITPVSVLPEWHYAAGRQARVFVDEIIVR